MLFLFIQFIIHNGYHIHFRETNIQKSKSEHKTTGKKKENHCAALRI